MRKTDRGNEYLCSDCREKGYFQEEHIEFGRLYNYCYKSVERITFQLQLFSCHCSLIFCRINSIDHRSGDRENKKEEPVGIRTGRNNHFSLYSGNYNIRHIYVP